MGLGQVYNGEIFKGIVLNLIFWATFFWYGWYTVSAYFGPSYDLVFFLITLGGFLLLKIYSIGQAFVCSRRWGKAYQLKPVNRWYVYLLFVLILLIPPFFLNTAIRNQSLRDIEPPHPFRSEIARSVFLNHYDKQSEQWPVESETRVVKSSYGKTFVWISGPEEAPPLVLLHGGPSNSLQWIYNIQALSRNYRTYAIDIIIGTGRSINTRAIEKTSELVSWLDETLTGLGLENDINMMGLSYGGWITSQYVLARQNRLNKVILIAPAGTVSPLSMKWIKYAILTIIPHRHFMKNFLYWVLPDFYRKDRTELDRHIDDSYLAMRCFKPAKLLNPTVITEAEWKQLRTPLLFLIGENERIYSRKATEVVKYLNTVAPRISTKIIPRAGHDLVFVQAERVNRLVLEFLK
ncbi:MAG: alpha/beta hydrolase [Candidatus Aminicenantes bacterium]|nr:alpha/beta hydrolase [Candidatus Aminicenantes bacterium]